MEKWMVANKKADFKALGKDFGIDQVTARLLRNRNLTSREEIRLFLHGGREDLYDPHLLKDADLLADILLEKIQGEKKIRIIGDYDIDGVMSCYILKSALQRCGAEADVEIPDRIADGYGLNESLIQRAAEEGIDTILTCDNGIAALEEIALAKRLGMTVLVTDHHEIPFEEEGGIRREKKSAADSVVNAHQQACSYPNKDLCGAAVAWKVVCILYERLHIPKEEAEDFLENVAFATVGDVMPLKGENRILVKEGLKNIRHTHCTGMKALIARCGLTADQISSYHFGYVLGPCINASGRLDTAKRALELFLETDERKAALIAEELVVLNAQRKELTNAAVAEAVEVYEKEGYEKDLVAVIYLRGVHESIAGIVAGRVREICYKPTFILTDGAQGVKGSGRSIPEYSMYEELCKCRELLQKFGGHPMAAGLSLDKSKVETFRQRINEVCPIPREAMEPVIHIDVPMPLDYATLQLVQEFELLAPFGRDNERPMFADRNVSLARMWVVGKNRNVLRLTLVSESGRRHEGVFFGDIPGFMDYLSEKFGEGEVEAAREGKENGICIAIVYRPSVNRYNGLESLQFEIKAYR